VSTFKFPSHLKEFDTVVFRKHLGRTALEAEYSRTSAATLVARTSGLFSVPQIVKFDPHSGVLESERIQDLTTLRQMALTRDPQLYQTLLQAGACLAAVHASLKEDRVDLLPLPAFLQPEDERVFLHGDFTVDNVAISPGRGQLFVYDWSTASMLGGHGNYGSRHFDLVWFTGYLFQIAPPKLFWRWNAEQMASCFLAGYQNHYSAFDSAAYARFGLCLYPCMMDWWRLCEGSAKSLSPLRRVTYAFWRNVMARRWKVFLLREVRRSPGLPRTRLYLPETNRAGKRSIMDFAVRLREQITRYRPEYRGALVDFQREMFGAESRQANPEHFQWLFARNPFHENGNFPVWLCMKDGKVVGQQCAIPTELNIRNQRHPASWAVDLMVRPEWRLKGVGPALSETAAPENGITAALGVSDPAYKAYLRAGWIDLGLVPEFVRPVDVASLMKVRSFDRRLTRLAGPAAGWLMRMNHRVFMACVYPSKAVTQRIADFDARVDRLWLEVKEHYPVIARRDWRALRWRFDAAPDPSRYCRFYLLEQDQLRGYAVVRLSTRDTLPVAVIVDYLASPRWQAPLVASCIQHLGTKVAAIYCATLNPSLHASLRMLGFLRLSTGPRFMLRLPEGYQGLQTVLADRQNWFLTMADSDYELCQ